MKDLFDDLDNNTPQIDNIDDSLSFEEPTNIDVANVEDEISFDTPAVDTADNLEDEITFDAPVESAPIENVEDEITFDAPVESAPVENVEDAIVFDAPAESAEVLDNDVATEEVAAPSEDNGAAKPKKPTLPKQVVMPGQSIHPADGRYIYFPKPYKRRTKDKDVPRTSGFGGSAGRYALMSIWYFFLGIISLGLLAPVGFYNKKKYVITRSYVDGRKLGFAGRVRGMYFKYLFGMILCILTLGLYYYRMRTLLESWFTENTYFEDTEGQLNIAPSVFTGTASEYFGVVFKAVLLNILTIGLISPITNLWIERFFMENRYINGRQMKYTVKGGGYYGLHIGWFFVSLLTVIGACVFPIAKKKYLYKRVTIGDELFDDDSVLDDGMTYDDVQAFNAPDFDIASYAKATAAMNKKPIADVAAQLKPRVKWARANANSLQLARVEKSYRKKSRKFKRVGSAFVVAFLMLALLFGTIFGGVYLYQNYRTEIVDAINGIIDKVGGTPIDASKLPDLQDVIEGIVAQVQAFIGQLTGGGSGGESPNPGEEVPTEPVAYVLPSSVALC